MMLLLLLVSFTCALKTIPGNDVILEGTLGAM